MLFGYRQGKYPITAKAWRKLRSAEIAAGIAVATEEERAEFSARSRVAAPLFEGAPAGRGATPSPASDSTQRGVIAPHHSDFIPGLATSEQDVRAYIERVLAAAAGDPRRLATLIEVLEMHVEPWLRKWRPEQPAK